LFDVVERRLQFQDGLAGFQIGILLRNSKDFPERRGNAILDVHARRRRQSASPRLRSQLDEIVQHASLVLHVPARGFDEIGDEIVAFIEKRIEAAEGIANLVLLGDQGVENQNTNEYEDKSAA